MNNFDAWVQQMRVAIQGASIARECHDKMARGEGAPNEDDMRRFAGDAAALADLWHDAVVTGHRSGHRRDCGGGRALGGLADGKAVVR
jgi:hypothetical protein